MFVGHALLAFALTAGVAVRAGTSRERALTLGAVAGAFAAAPDVDIAYALVGVAGAGVAPPLAVASAFWSAGSVVHRAVTHSLVVAPVAAVAVAAVAAGSRGRRAGWVAATLLLAALAAVAGVASGPLAAVVMALFGLTLAAIAILAVRWAGVGPRAAFATALVGLVSHPFGDLFTGEPPAFLYPLDATLVAGRVGLSPDPTLHLLAAFGVELLVVWVAFVTFVRLLGGRVLPSLGPRAGLGAGYAALLPLLPAPTLDLSYPFVLTVLAVGALGLLPRVEGRGPLDAVGPSLPAVGRRSGESRRTDAFATGVDADRLRRALGSVGTGLAAVTLAWGAYAAAYVALA